MSARHPAVAAYNEVQATVLPLGWTWEGMLMAALANAHGRLISSTKISTLLHGVARLCDEHDSPNVVGFDDAAVAIERIVEDLDRDRIPSAEDRREADSEQRAELRKDDQLTGSHQ